MNVTRQVRRAARQVEAALLDVRWRRDNRSALARFDRYRDFTMVPEPVFVANLRLARLAVWKRAGDLVECGAWRGGMSAAIAEHVDGDHVSVLFDSFEGLPPANASLDGTWGVRERAADPFIAAEDDARRAMAMSGREHRIVKGWFDDTVPKYAAEGRPIALLRLDADLYDSTMTCLEHLFDLVVPGGFVIVDDYGVWEGCTRAVHDFLSRERRTEPMQSIDGVYFLQKAHQ